MKFRREQTLLRVLLDEVPDPVFLKDLEARIVVANRAALAVIGKTAEQVLGKTAAEYLENTPAGRESFECDLKVLRAGASASFEQVFPGPTGPRVLLTTTSPLRDNRGHLIGLIGVSRDITDRKAAVSENARRLAVILEATSGGFWDWNVQTGDTVFSPGCAAMLGYAPDEFVRNYAAWKDLVHSDDLGRVEQHHADHFAGRTAFAIEFRMKEKSGNWHWIHSRGLLIERDSEGRPLRMVGTYSDIQARKRAEEERERLQAQLSHAQKMECVGRLAGGIAHDFSNLMSVILLHADSALEALSGSDSVSGSLDAIRQAAGNAVALTRQLLAFSNKQEGKFETLDLNSTLAGCEKLVRPLIGEDIELVFHYGRGLPLVELNPGQLYQVVMNFAVNARDAMPEGGTFTIETSAVEDAVTAGVPDSSPGPYVSLAFRDTGVGMDADTQAQVFEPFFTTKEVGKGTGLGLSVVYGIVKQAKGYITVHSEAGRGSEFRIYLPGVLAPPLPVSQDPPERDLRGSETILLVEDEDVLRKTVVNILGRAGYRVLAAAEADRAIELDLETVPPPDLLLTDIVMPGVSGIELGRHLRERRPGTKILYMSGYPEAAALAPVISAENLVTKPFTARELLLRVRQALELRAGGGVRSAG